VTESSEADYQARVADEICKYQTKVHVHDLPDIFHYWSDGKIRPKLERFGFSSPKGLFEKFLEETCQGEAYGPKRFISIGSGNCDLEIGLAQHLLAKGYSDFVIDCLDINPTMLERGRVQAREKGVEVRIGCLPADFNRWEPDQGYDAVIACQALHHVVNLEGLFKNIRDSLKPNGAFIISDMVGRNGHRRWPEAFRIVQEFWKELPQSYRFNQMLLRQEESYVNWDCSTEAFEGIRSQEILPLLLKNFHFQLFVAYGNIIDPFVDRAFGHNFDASAEWDRNFIDRVHERDEQEMLAGRIKPVHMEAVVRKQPCEAMQFHAPFTPEFCVRWPDPADNGGEAATAPMPRSAEQELEAATARIWRLEDDNAALHHRMNTLENRLRVAADSRWMKLGRKMGWGPKLP
jgi:SAM-dependent methyltransferase